MQKIITIHQPEHLPYLGFFDKVRKADKFIILDSVPFEKNYFQNRNLIKLNGVPHYITVPVKKPSLTTLLREVEISPDHRWKRKYLESIRHAYGKTPFFGELFPQIEFIINEPIINLVVLNMRLLLMCFRWFKMLPEIYISTAFKLPAELSGSNLLLELCRWFSVGNKEDEWVYLSGPSGTNYLDIESFDNYAIDVQFNNFEHPVYKQTGNGFCYNLSALDYMFNCGHELQIGNPLPCQE